MPRLRPVTLRFDHARADGASEIRGRGESSGDRSRAERFCKGSGRKRDGDELVRLQKVSEALGAFGEILCRLVAGAERAGFEPAVRGNRTRHFQCRTIGLSVTSPEIPNFGSCFFLSRLSPVSLSSKARLSQALSTIGRLSDMPVRSIMSNRAYFTGRAWISARTSATESARIWAGRKGLSRAPGGHRDPTVGRPAPEPSFSWSRQREHNQHRVGC